MQVFRICGRLALLCLAEMPLPVIDTQGGWTTGRGSTAGVAPDVVDVGHGQGMGGAFTFVFSDPQGYSDIDSASIVFGTAPTGQRSCFFRYHPASSMIFLADDMAVSWSGGVLGVNGTVSNSRCSIDVGRSKAMFSGDQVSLTVELAFATSFETRTYTNVYASVADNASNICHWKVVGSYTVTSGDIDYGAPPGVTVTRRSVTSRSFTGDLWPSTWAGDDSLFFAWGDGTGQAECIPTSNWVTPLEQINWRACGNGGFSADTKCLPADWDCTGPASVCRFLECRPDRCYPLCRLTRAGVRRDTGPVTALSTCSTTVRAALMPGFFSWSRYQVRQDSCIIDRDPPDHDLTTDKKFSSLLSIDNKLYGHMHAPCCLGTRRGFLVVRDETGWTVVGRNRDPANSPWGESSHFRVGMFIQMGKGFALSRDGYVYMLGIDREVLGRNVPVYLARVPRGKLADPAYAAWEYFSVKGATRRFVATQAAATPVLGDLGSTASLGGGTMAQGSALYHPGLGKYLFLTGLVDAKPGDTPDTMSGALYWADAPWGPWTRVRTFRGPQNRGGVFSLIAKDAGPNCVYFAYAGLPHATILSYTFKIDSLVFGTRCEKTTDCGCGSICRQGVCTID